ncbi:MAG: hypothetical protein WCG08_13810, partial [Paludibacter sp.]
MKKLLLIYSSLLVIIAVHAQTEQIISTENFQGWTNFTASTATPNNIVSKSTILTNETLTYTMYGISVANTGY